jgi:hypothetical protein
MLIFVVSLLPKLLKMKKYIAVSLFAAFMLLIPYNLFSQSTTLNREFGLTLGGFTNFPANKHYLDDNIKVISLAPYVIIGKHEFYAGIVYPLKANGLNWGTKLDSRPGFVAGYKYYIFNKAGRENMYVNYSFQFLRFKGTPDVFPDMSYEINDYINNVISLGYVVYFDRQQRFGMYYSLGYVISQGSYNNNYDSPSGNLWNAQYIWDHINTNVGFSFKLKNFDRKTP